VRYLVTVTNGRPTGRRVLDTRVTRRPQPQVVVTGVADRPDCGEGLYLCVPLSRGAVCPDGRLDDVPEDASAAPPSGDVTVGGNQIDVLSQPC
jgi:G5 domain